jgi:hypothetical protein
LNIIVRADSFRWNASDPLLPRLMIVQMLRYDNACCSGLTVYSSLGSVQEGPRTDKRTIPGC